MASEGSHSDLCQVAVRWLRKSFQSGGHGCQIAFAEPRISYLGGESPDAIGFRVSEPSYGGGSVVVECKTSRSDFLADARKPHRRPGEGMGRFRYFMAPDGLIEPAELPCGWGLVEVGKRNRTRVVRGAVTDVRNLQAWEQEHNAVRETLLLANLLHRIGDAGKMNTRLRDAEGRAGWLLRRCEGLEKEVSRLQAAEMKRKYGHMMPDL